MHLARNSVPNLKSVEKLLGSKIEYRLTIQFSTLEKSQPFKILERLTKLYSDSFPFITTFKKLAYEFRLER